MQTLRRSLASGIGKKLIIGITGLGLILFVVGHLSGNLLLYLGFENYNAYAAELHSNEILLHIVEVALLLTFLIHISLAIKVSREHRQARPEHYKMHRSKQGKTRFTASSIMLISGSIVLAFLLLHLADLRFNLRHHVASGVSPASHTLLVLQDPISGTVYFLGSLFLGWHIWHAFQSVFQTYGLNHNRYTPWIKKIGIVLAIILGLGFASFPVWGLLVRLGVVT